jgi:DNA mismatch endonuclease, patch repair protein
LIDAAMADVLTPEQRRFNMSRIRNRNTRPEMKVRSIVHQMGYRYRLHSKDLPGKPDLVFPGRRKIIFVHGCFFHMHDCPYGRVVPKTNAEFWQTKRLSNVERDRRNLVTLENDGWLVLIVWECMTKRAQIENLPQILEEFLK